MAPYPVSRGNYSPPQHHDHPASTTNNDRTGFGWLLRGPLLCGLALIVLSAIPARSAPPSTVPTTTKPTMAAVSKPTASTPLQSKASTEENSSGRMQFQNSQGVMMEAPLLQTNVELWVNGMITTTVYRQTFHNPSTQWVEGRYLFPLPDTAAVNGMTMRIGERVIVGEVQEKLQARNVYQQAKTAGKQVSLVEQHRPNLFSQAVANIPPGEHIQVTLTYREVAHYEHGNFSLRLPLTITPRYIPGLPIRDAVDESPETVMTEASEAKAAPLVPTVRAIHINQQGWGQATDQVADAALITAPMSDRPLLPNGTTRNPVRITVHLRAGLPLARIDSPYHDIAIHKHGDEHTITLSEGQVAMDRDFVLSWQPVKQKTPHVALFSEHLENADSAAGSDYVLLMLLPPQASAGKIPSGQQHTVSLPREVIFIVDTSGSMAGTSIEQAKASLQLALTTLSPHDRFNIIAFNSNYRSYSTHPLPATGTNLRGAQGFVDRLHAHGGTEMYPPLDAVLSEHATEGFLKQVIFITDGSVGNEGALFHLIEQKLRQARLFTVGIGSAPNSFFMRKSAQFGRGTFTHVGNLAEVSEKMSALFRQLQTPLLQDIEVNWPTDFSTEAFPIRSPDLYHGQPLLIKAKLTHRQSAQGAAQYSRSASDGSITVSGHSASGPWSRTLSIAALKERPADHQNPTGKGIGSLWGRAKISTLMDQKHSGVPEADVKPQVLEVALTHQLLSAYTSFIAVDKTPARPPETTLKSSAIPNLVAKGQKAMPHTLLSTQPHSPAQYSPHSYPQTALGLNGQLLMGTLCALLALLFMTAGKLLMIPPERRLKVGSLFQPCPQPVSQHALQGQTQGVKVPSP